MIFLEDIFPFKQKDSQGVMTYIQTGGPKVDLDEPEYHLKDQDASPLLNSHIADDDVNLEE